jgi:hypothetical protein
MLIKRFLTSKTKGKVMSKNKKKPMNCGKCGRFIGKDGNDDVYYDDWNGGWECGSPRCGKCLKKESEKKDD